MIYVLGVCFFTETGTRTETVHGLSKDASIELFETVKEEAIKISAEMIMHLHEIDDPEEDNPEITTIKRFRQRPEGK